MATKRQSSNQPEKKKGKCVLNNV